MAEALRLAIFHDQNSHSILQLYGAAHDWCQIVWVVGWSLETPPIRVLSRFGDVVDLTGLSDAEAIDHLVALQFDGVIVFNDSPLRLAAALAEQLGLPFHSPDTARLLTDKLAQRTALLDAGLLVPAFAPVQSGDSEVTVPFPAVLKPRAGAGSRDTFRIETRAQLAEILAGCSQDEKFILEEWLPDRINAPGLGSDVVSVESFVREGTIEHIAVTGRFPFASPFRETGSFLPSDIGSTDRELVVALAAAAAEAMQIRHGILHIELKLTPAGPRIVEVNGRLGGGIDGMIARIGGPSLLVLAMRLALGHDVGPITSLPTSPVAFFRWIVPPVSARKVDAVDGLEKLNSLPGIDEVRLNRHPGDLVDSRQSSHVGHVVRLDGQVPSHAELALLIYDQIPSALRLTWGFS